jgi:sugar lactone lactonase YvrE
MFTQHTASADDSKQPTHHHHILVRDNMQASFVRRLTCRTTLAAVILLAAACGHTHGEPPETALAARATQLSLLAGASSGQGYLDGARANARFSYVQGMRFDAAGNMLVADARNAVIRKIDPAGRVSTLAGTPGINGSADGTGTGARFNMPSDVATDAKGNVYVTDTGNAVIRKITPAGMVTTLAGSAGQSGAADGIGAEARFSGPSGLVADQHGNLYVADNSNQLIRKITPDGAVSTLAGTAGASGHVDGAGADARFRGPSSIAIDSAGILYVTDGDHTIRRITAGGVVSTVAGVPGISGSSDGAAASALFNGPSGITVDAAGNLTIMDGNNSTLRKIRPGGVVSTAAGSAGKVGNIDGAAAQARFKGPGRVLSDAAGNVYISDNNSAIRKVGTDGVVSTWAGATGGAGSADGVGATARFNFPNGLAIDGQHNLYVADQDNSTVRKISAAGAVTTLAGSAGVFGYMDGTGAAAQFSGVGGIAVDPMGNVYVTEFYNHTVRKISPAGVVSTLAGSAGQSGYAEGRGGQARFSSPNNAAVDAQGNVYITDYANNAIRKITPDGTVSTFAGAAESGSADGAASVARFNGPNSLAFDAHGNLWVTDAGNNTVRKITAAGVVSTVAGTAGAPGSSDGVATAARFNYPWGIAVDSRGALYVADAGNNSVRRIDHAGKVTTIIGGGVNYQNLPGRLPAGLAYPIGLAIDPASDTLYVTAPDAVFKASLK